VPTKRLSPAVRSFLRDDVPPSLRPSAPPPLPSLSLLPRQSRNPERNPIRHRPPLALSAPETAYVLYHGFCALVTAIQTSLRNSCVCSVCTSRPASDSRLGQCGLRRDLSQHSCAAPSCWGMTGSCAKFSDPNPPPKRAGAPACEGCLPEIATPHRHRRVEVGTYHMPRTVGVLSGRRESPCCG
jgi:hypothetical protein